MKHFILSPQSDDESLCNDKIGFEKYCKFYCEATEEDKEKMVKVIRAGDWNSFKKLLSKY